MADLILSLPRTHAGPPPSLIPLSETRYYPAIKAGRLISTQIGERFSGLVWVQQYEEEKLVSINRSRDLQGGVSGSSVILSRVKLCLELNKEGHTVGLKYIISDKLENGKRTHYENEVDIFLSNSLFSPLFQRKTNKNCERLNK